MQPPGHGSAALLGGVPLTFAAGRRRDDLAAIRRASRRPHPGGPEPGSARRRRAIRLARYQEVGLTDMRILGEGVTDSLDYSTRKGEFIVRVLRSGEVPKANH